MVSELSNSINIRTATAADKPSIQHIYYCLVGPPTGQESGWDRLISIGGLVVAESSSEVFAFGGIDVDAPEQLRWLYVLPEYQRTGVGRRLLQQLENVGWNAGLKALRVHAAPPAENFYARHGYQRVTEPEQIKHEHDGVEMIKRRLT